VVIWLGNNLRELGRQPAILLRGYGSTAGQGSDEAMLMDQSLNAGPLGKVPVRPSPSRVKAAAEVLSEFPAVDVFLLDDAFQHRKARRDFNLLLISATEPFGRGHVLPRGFLREPMAGLARADAFVITRCASVGLADVQRIESALHHWNAAAPIYHADHSITHVRLVAEDRLVPTQFLAGKKVFVEASIADPASLHKQIAAFGCEVVATGGFDDHHSYTQPQIERLVQTARTADAELIVTTEKDWVKIRGVIQPQHQVMFAVTKLDLVFRADDGDKLIEQIQKAIESLRI
jgi:tetraacyldisaccharide 4'-kinase